MGFAAYLREGLRHPPHVAARKASALLCRVVKEHRQRRRALRSTSYLPVPQKGDIRRRIRLENLPTDERRRPAAGQAALLYLEHRVDLLGSGWVQVKHGMDCAGLAGCRSLPEPAVSADPEGEWLRQRVSGANLSESRRIWSLIEQPYAPIDWQLDFKSGFRWSELSHYSEIRYGNRRGADVKAPWELARLQHLPQLAVAYRRAAAIPDEPTAESFVREFRNQTLDFIATNPPQFGVNWVCAMDVAIRIANILLAFDLFRDAGVEFDAAFTDLVKRSADEHARHILDNIEWSDGRRGNHYLSDIVGLLFVAAYLPRSATVDGWLVFAAAELIAEAEGQFLPDGGNIEASTAYHRLSGELVLFGSAIILGLEPGELEPFAGSIQMPKTRVSRAAETRSPRPTDTLPSVLPASVLRTLVAAAELTRDATKPSGHIVQWGDNDSGRLFKVDPAWVSSTVADAVPGAPPRENHLDHRQFVAGVAALTDRRELAEWAGPWTDAAIALALAGGRMVRVAAAARPNEDGVTLHEDLPEPATDAAARLFRIPVPPEAVAGLRVAAYPDFGHYAIIGDRFFLAFRCPNRAEGPGPGHAHDDALAVELQVDRRDLVTDPGTYVYTPLPEERDRYRVATAHFVPRVLGARSADISAGLFAIDALARCRCLAFGSIGFVGELRGNDWGVRRIVTLKGDHILICDQAVKGELLPLPVAGELPRVCAGYGVTTDAVPFSTDIFAGIRN